jgi:hypothetical protein
VIRTSDCGCFVLWLGGTWLFHLFPNINIQICISTIYFIVDVIFMVFIRLGICFSLIHISEICLSGLYSHVRLWLATM